ncbi:AAA family ATPase [Desulforhabdus sp. TSK]|uniref:AAA family ATPase n=1 Tax=Desulforhabdus sp. TSK TaxID=2925014 RepID=UPI001FC81A70|nr:AAA family ATPase [Desulforhabdus sp. TSK]GKT09787.1 hypothetical protein DSTSK_30920 [Desulforhabdus sp. TSK]
MHKDQSLKIIRLAAENIKKLRAVQITPEGHIVQISGPNAAGKTSVLDSIWYALGGGQALPEEPIRKGAAKAEIRLDLGEMLVTRTFTHKGSYLKVMNKEGLEWKSPQKVLDQLLGKLSFDPLAFARLDEGKQRELLLSLVTIPLSYEHLQRLSGIPAQENGDPIGAMNAVYKTVYEQRADHHRNAKRLEAVVAAVEIPPGMETVQPVSATQLLSERKRLEEENGRNDGMRRELLGFERSHEALKERRDELEQKKQDLLRQLQETEDLISGTESLLESSQEEVLRAVSAVRDLVDHDLSEIDARITQADELNRIAADMARRRELKDELELELKGASECTAKLDAIARYKTELMERTDFPVAGLDFRNGKVVYNGVPVSQASTAEKLRVGMAIAMALNPRLRIIRIEDGSLLDRESWRGIEEMARQGDYQVWIETVADEPGQGIYIYDGQVVSDNGNQEAQQPAVTCPSESFSVFDSPSDSMLM